MSLYNPSSPIAVHEASLIGVRLPMFATTHLECSRSYERLQDSNCLMMKQGSDLLAGYDEESIYFGTNTEPLAYGTVPVYGR